MADCRGPFPNCFSLQLLLWNCILWFPCDGTEADFSFNFHQAFPFFSPSLSPFCAFFSKRAKLMTCCDVSFFSVVVHCLLFCPPPPSVLILMFSYVSATETKQKISFFPSLSVALLNPYLLLSFSLFQLFFLIYLLFPLHSSTVSLADSYSSTPVRGPDETLRVLWPLFHIGATISDKPSAAMPSKVYTHMHMHARTNTCAMS